MFTWSKLVVGQQPTIDKFPAYMMDIVFSFFHIGGEANLAPVCKNFADTYKRRWLSMSLGAVIYQDMDLKGVATWFHQCADMGLTREDMVQYRKIENARLHCTKTRRHANNKLGRRSEGQCWAWEEE